MAKQLFVTPIPEGWALVSYGDEVLPDDELVPLPLTDAVSYAEVVEFVTALPVAEGAFIDGWDTADLLAELEPELWERAFEVIS